MACSCARGNQPCFWEEFAHSLALLDDHPPNAEKCRNEYPLHALTHSKILWDSSILVDHLNVFARELIITSLRNDTADSYSLVTIA